MSGETAPLTGGGGLSTRARVGKSPRAPSMATQQATTPLGEGWLEVHQPNGQPPWYVHQASNRTQWERPVVSAPAAGGGDEGVPPPRGESATIAEAKAELATLGKAHFGLEMIPKAKLDALCTKYSPYRDLLVGAVRAVQVAAEAEAAKKALAAEALSIAQTAKK
eukprot:COSAG06_NODE_21910_length_741_cov_0.915888_1_plen_164_part_10